MSDKDKPFKSDLTLPEWTGIQLTQILNSEFHRNLDRGFDTTQAAGISLVIAGKEVVSHVSGERSTNSAWVTGPGSSVASNAQNQELSAGQLRPPDASIRENGHDPNARSAKGIPS